MLKDKHAASGLHKLGQHCQLQYGSEGVKCKGVILKRVHPRASLAVSLRICGAAGSVGLPKARSPELEEMPIQVTEV